MSTCQRWMMVGLLSAGAAMAAENGAVPVRTVDGNLDAHARLQTIHAEMRHECGASPGSGMTTTITCIQCGGPLGSGDQYCSQCGTEVLWCASCGEFLAEESCPKCGTPGIPRPASHNIPCDLTEEDSPWAEVVARLRRATMGEFEIGHELGRGGMAAVFLAHEL